MYICKHCNKQVPSLDDVPIHDCFIGKTVFLEENNNVLFYAEDKREYNKRILSILFHLLVIF